jgi:cation channel sperm-associated protein 2
MQLRNRKDARSKAKSGDISLRGRVFKDHLIEEFRVEENLGFDYETTPKTSTSDIINSQEPRLFKDFLLKNPHQLVRFKIFKRSALDDIEEGIMGLDETDPLLGDNLNGKRLMRVRNRSGKVLPLSEWALWISTHPYFDAVIFFFIILSTVIQGVQTQMDQATSPLLYDIMDIFDDISLIVFSIEIVIKWIYSFEKFWYDGWNIFDFLATVLSAVPRLLLLYTGGDSSGVGDIGTQLRLFRTMRVLKMVARVQTLRLVIQTVIEAFNALGFILLLLLLFTYMFAVFSINLFYPYTISLQPGLKYQDKFKDLPSAFITLFQLLTLDQWFAIQADIQKIVSPVVVISFFIFWVWIGAFIFRNVFVGVMVRKFDDIHNEVRRNFEKKQAEKKARKALMQLQKELQDMDAEALSDDDEDFDGDHTEAFSDEEEDLSEIVDVSMSSNAAHFKKAGVFGSMKRRLQEDEHGRVDELLVKDDSNMQKWVRVVQSTLEGLKTEKKEYVWSRDALFEYLTTMEQLQNNMREYQELQYLASVAIFAMCEENA